MNLWKRLGLATTTAAKAFGMVFSASRSWGSYVLGATRMDWYKSVGDPTTNAIVIACVKWIQRTFPEAPMMMYRREGTRLIPLPAHRLTKLLDTPNPFYSGLDLWGATIADFIVTGNAYWILVRAGNGRLTNPVAHIWWVPSYMMEPAWDEHDSTTDKFITHYVYTVNGKENDVPIENVIHFRNGFDPNNIRLGISDLASLIREIATDNEAANWSAALLHNMGVPGIIITPGKDVSVDEDDMNRIKDAARTRFGGDKRGEPLVLSAEAKVERLSMSPEELTLKEVRRVPEERVTAVIGTPAVVVGLGAGLDRSTFTNMGDARRMAYRSCLIPMKRIMAATIQTRLVPNFGNPDTLVAAFDYTQVIELQPDYNELANRLGNLVSRGIYTVNTALAELGKDPLPNDVLYVPTSAVPTDPSKVLLARNPVAETLPPAGEDDDDEPPAAIEPEDPKHVLSLNSSRKAPDDNPVLVLPPAPHSMPVSAGATRNNGHAAHEGGDRA